MYGTQTPVEEKPVRNRFENDVKMYGTQTKEGLCISCRRFENDVKMYGTQTNLSCEICHG